jgi:ssDNA thymidine ADP-ribosyltransferase, DarT
MLYNIRTGRNVPALPMRDIVIFATSLHRLAAQRIPFVFSDRHAYLVPARFSNDTRDLDWIDWGILQRSDFAYDANDLGKMERYQAEALVHEHLPMSAVTGILCYDRGREAYLRNAVQQANHTIQVFAKPRYFF